MSKPICSKLAPLSAALGCVLLISAAGGCGSPDPEHTAGSNPPAAPAEAPSSQVGRPVEHQIACDEIDGIRPVCGFRNPEDLAVVPGGRYLLVSEMGAFMSDEPNTLSLLEVDTETRQPLIFDWEDPGAGRWGDPACSAPDPERFSPHGIDLITRADGRHQLLVVNHGDEQIELFELANRDGRWGVHWQGCARPPGDPFLNDVAGLQGGGFVATHMWDKSLPFEEVVERLTSGVNTGWLWEWQPGSGFTKIPNFEALMPNGIAVSADNNRLFVNIYMGNQTVIVDRATGEVTGAFDIKNPDNVVVDVDGNLWVASHLNDPIEGRCEEGHPGPCLLPFQVVKADPETMRSEVVFKHDGEPMGYATVALPHRGRIYLGSASGDRIASVAIATAENPPVPSR